MGASSSDLVRKEVKLRGEEHREWSQTRGGTRVFSAEEIPVKNNIALERRRLLGIEGSRLK